MAWLYLFLAGLFEIVWALGLKYTHGFTRVMPTTITLITMGISFYLLSLSLKTLPIGTAYAIWTGIGAVGTVLLGILLFKEPATLIRLSCIGLIIAGMVGLKVSSGH